MGEAPLKVLHVNDHYDRVGGAETILHLTLAALEERGIRNVIVHQHPASGNPADRVLYHIPCLGDPSPPDRRKILRTLRQIVEKEQPDLIHLYDVGNPDVLAESGRLRPSVQSVLNHSFYCPGGQKYLPFLRRACTRPFGPGCLASAFLTHCNSIRPNVLLSSYRYTHQALGRRDLLLITLSRYQEACLIQSGYPPEAIRTLHPFTGLPDLPSQGPPPSQEPLLLFTGRIVAGKGLDLLLKTLAGVKHRFRLRVDGSGLLLEECRGLAARLGLQEKVQFMGWTLPEQHQANYLQSDLVVVPSIWPEPFGLVGIEAMSYAKPVVAFRVGGIPEWLEDGVTGHLIEPYDLRAMASKIDDLLERPERAQEMGRQGRRRVEALFSKAAYVTALMEIYRQAASRPPHA